MKQKSISLRQLRPRPQLAYKQFIPSSYSALPPASNYNSRLAYPQVGDSRFYMDVGKKHYDNQSDRLLKIVLPQKYALENPMIRRERSIPPPHLQTEFSERISNPDTYSSSKVSTSKPSIGLSIKYRVQDQLDRMKQFFDKNKISYSQSEGKRLGQQQNRYNERSGSMHISQNQPVLSPSLESSKASKKTTLLYNPQNKHIYDQFDLARSKNPTNLSTGLSII